MYVVVNGEKRRIFVICYANGNASFLLIHVFTASFARVERVAKLKTKKMYNDCIRLLGSLSILLLEGLLS